MAELSSVETLRAAAERLRATAEGTSGPPWYEDGWQGVYAYGGPDESCPDVFTDRRVKYEDVQWISLVHPGIAEPLADWLDAQAEDLGWHMAAWTHVNPSEEHGFFGQAARDPQRLAKLTDDHSGRALAVARVLLGGAGCHPVT